MPIGIGEPIAAAFGKRNEAPKPVFLPGTRRLIQPLSYLGKDALESLRTGGAAAEAAYNAGTAKQTGLLGEQEALARDIIGRRQNQTPEDLLRSIGNTAFGFINPNVVAPLARFDVNSDRLRRLAAGLGPAADSTAQRLRDARIASGRYYDVARQVYGALPSLYNQAVNAGLASDEFSLNQLPAIMAAYRNIDRSPLEAAGFRSTAAGAGAGNVAQIADAIRKGVYGYQQPTNWADRLGQVDLAMRDSLNDAISAASRVYGLIGGIGGLGGAAGGMGAGQSTADLGGILGGTGGGRAAGAAAGGGARFIPYG